MRILGIGADQNNSRDGVIVAGIRNLIHPWEITDYLLIDDHSPMSDSLLFPDVKFDKIIYCGTPFLWDGMSHSDKYKNVARLLELHPEAKMIWLGIGSSLYLGEETGPILRDIWAQKMLKRTFKPSHTVVVRDNLASSILWNAGVTHSLLPCPSYYIPCPNKSTLEHNIAFYHAPLTGIAQGWFKRPDRLDNYNAIFKEFISRYDAKVVVCEHNEIEAAKIALGVSDVEWIQTPQDTFRVCQTANKVLSGRVHNAVPALVYGCEVGIVPVDSRNRVVTDFFPHIKITAKEELNNIRRCDINFSRNLYTGVFK